MTISAEEFEARRKANASGGPFTHVCRCGHSFARHALYRDPTPSSPNAYHYYECFVEGCNCRRFLSQYDAAQAAL